MKDIDITGMAGDLPLKVKFEAIDYLEPGTNSIVRTRVVTDRHDQEEEVQAS